MIRKVFLMIAALSAVSAATAQERFIADKIVAVVGNSPILYSDVVKQAAQITERNRAENFTSPRDPMAEALEVLLEQKLLYNQAQIDSVSIDRQMGQIADYVNNNVNDMVKREGSIKALENKMRKPLYSIKDDTRKEIEEYFYAQEMRNTKGNEVKVTPGEVDRFFRGLNSDSLPIIPEQYVYAQITKLPKSSELARQRARERLLDMRQRVIDGDRFDRLAVMYSIDPGSAMRGGEMDPAPAESFVEPFRNALVKLRPGQVSGVVETEFGFHIIQLIDKPADNLYHLRHILVKPQYTDGERKEAVDFLDSLGSAIRNGDITFEKAAMENSDDEGSRMNGGLVSNQQLLFRYTGNTDPSQTRTRFIKDNLEPGDFRALSQLKPGKVSAAFIGTDFTGNELGKMLKLVEIVPAHKANLSHDYLDIEQMALVRKKEAHYNKWLNAKIDEMYIRIDPMFRATDFGNPRWFK